MALSFQRKRSLFHDSRSRKSYLERETGIEPATLCLGSRCSTAELLPPATHYAMGNARWGMGALGSSLSTSPITEGAAGWGPVSTAVGRGAVLAGRPRPKGG